MGGFVGAVEAMASGCASELVAGFEVVRQEQAVGMNSPEQALAVAVESQLDGGVAGALREASPAACLPGLPDAAKAIVRDELLERVDWIAKSSLLVNIIHRYVEERERDEHDKERLHRLQVQCRSFIQRDGCKG